MACKQTLNLRCVLISDPITLLICYYWILFIYYYWDTAYLLLLGYCLSFIQVPWSSKQRALGPSIVLFAFTCLASIVPFYASQQDPISTYNLISLPFFPKWLASKIWI